MSVKAAVITVSDKGSRGEREDTSGPAVAEKLREAGFDVSYRSVIPDEQPVIIFSEGYAQGCTESIADVGIQPGIFVIHAEFVFRDSHRQREINHPAVNEPRRVEQRGFGGRHIGDHAFHAAGRAPRYPESISGPSGRQVWKNNNPGKQADQRPPSRYGKPKFHYMPNARFWIAHSD